MYTVCINDFTTGAQRVVCQLGYFNEAKDVCEETALKIVLDKEGVKYLDKTPVMRTKQTLLKGYNLVKSNSKFYKFVIYEKTPNGVFYTGQVRKLYTVFIVKVPRVGAYERRTYAISEDVQLAYEAVFLDIVSWDDPKDRLAQICSDSRYGLPLPPVEN